MLAVAAGNRTRQGDVDCGSGNLVAGLRHEAGVQRFEAEPLLSNPRRRNLSNDGGTQIVQVRIRRDDVRPPSSSVDQSNLWRFRRAPQPKRQRTAAVIHALSSSWSRCASQLWRSRLSLAWTTKRR